MELMEGLTLLSTSVENNASVFCFLAFLSFIILLASIFLTIFCARDCEYGGVFFGIVLTIVSLVLFFICLDGANDFPKTVYKVTIDESVSMVEFYERYEIIDQDGLIFTVYEKESQ